jgi:hypothetical protein
MELSVKDRSILEDVRDFVVGENSDSVFSVGGNLELIANHLPRLETEGKIQYDDRRKRYVVTSEYLPLLRTF